MRCRLQVVADDLAKVVKPGAAALAVPTDITKAEDVAALAEKCALEPRAPPPAAPTISGLRP